jgi:signal recognition particle subunit SRP54
MGFAASIQNAIKKFMGKTVVDEESVNELVKEIQKALITADVNVKQVFELSKKIKEQSLSKEMLKGISVRQHVIKVIYDELASILGNSYTPRLDRHKVMLVGLYGSGKTTTSAKLAYFYLKKGLNPYLISVDNDRPAAKEQLKQLSEKIHSQFCTSEGSCVEIIRGCSHGAAKSDVVIVDTAGRNAFDADLAKELRDTYNEFKPDEVFLVVSADIGQVAGKHARAFSEAVPITGVIVTKMDGSGKAGGALTAVAETNTKLAFIGVGEKTDNLEVYNSERFVSKLLGMPDFQSLMEQMKEIEKSITVEQSEEFDLDSFYTQMKAAKSAGSMGSMLGNMLGQMNVDKNMAENVDEMMAKFETIISSMTKKERKDPEMVRKSSSRVSRIAKGSGTSEKDVRNLINQFMKSKDIYSKFSKDRGFRNKISKLLKGGGGNVFGM